MRTIAAIAVSAAVTLGLAAPASADTRYVKLDPNRSIRSLEDWVLFKTNPAVDKYEIRLLGNGGSNKTAKLSLRFRGKDLSPGKTTWPDGVEVSFGPYDNRIDVNVPAEPRVITPAAPWWDWESQTWVSESLTDNVPVPLKGTFIAKQHVTYRKVIRGEKARWNCSVYFHDVCRWRDGRPKRVITRTLPTRKYVFTVQVDTRQDEDTDIYNVTKWDTEWYRGLRTDPIVVNEPVK